MGDSQKPRDEPKNSLNCDIGYEYLAYMFMLTYFNGDETLTQLWFISDNPLFGGISPLSLISLGRADKLYRFLDNVLSKDLP